ncbi:stalk domain-containing protein [Paenibacillus sp. y28]|uniref:stalk domain-containing protein n=1 Tax=Paenibacillus sp. y28 TaxID=3129110 RepID=UPI0030165FF7
MKTKLKQLSVVMAAVAALTAAMPVSAASQLAAAGDNNQLLTHVQTYSGSGAYGAKAEGSQQSASFRQPRGLAVLGDGSVLVADSGNEVIRRISGGQVSTYAGVTLPFDSQGLPLGTLLDGPRDESVFHSPGGLAADGAGNVIVADTDNHAIRKIAASGEVTTLAGNGVLGRTDGQGQKAQFYSPQAVAVKPDGTVFVADTLNHLIRRITADGTVTTLNASSKRVVEVYPGVVQPSGDYADGPLAEAKFNEPSGLVLDDKGNLYVSDSGNQRIRYIDFASGQVTTVAGTAGGYSSTALYADGEFADGAAADARFNFPKGLALTGEGGLVIADSMNHSVRYLFEGRVSTLAGSLKQTAGYRDSVDRTAMLQNPTNVAVQPDGSILVADTYNHVVRQIHFYSAPERSQGTEEIRVLLGAQPVEFDAAPEMVNGRTMVPVRAVTESLGYEVQFNDETKQVRLIKNGITLELAIGNHAMVRMETGAADQTKTIDAAPYMNHGRTYVPLRLFSEEMGQDVQWLDALRTVVIRNK